MTTQHAKSNAREGDVVAVGRPWFVGEEGHDTRGHAYAFPGDAHVVSVAVAQAEIDRLESAIAALQAQQGAEPVAWFPLLGTPFAVDRRLLNEEQALRNHSQSLDRLAQRGGLCPIEARAVVKREEFCGMDTRQAFADLIAAAPATGAPR